MDREDTHHRQPSTVSGPHTGYDRRGRIDHVFWRCERCGLETTDASLQEGCWRCEEAHAERACFAQ